MAAIIHLGIAGVEHLLPMLSGKPRKAIPGFDALR
jgi:hypothetical protein